MPTAPAILPQETASRARSRRARLRRISEYHEASWPEGDRLGVNAVRPADHQGIFMLQGPSFQNRQELVQVFQKKPDASLS